VHVVNRNPMANYFRFDAIIAGIQIKPLFITALDMYNQVESN